MEASYISQDGFFGYIYTWNTELDVQPPLYYIPSRYLPDASVNRDTQIDGHPTIKLLNIE